MVFFFSEVLTGLKVHPIQYVLVGFALLIFYLLLLSLAEYVGFATAYISASTATIALIGWYASFALGKSYLRAIFLALILLYAYLFTILHMEDYALLIGSVGLFVIMFLVMNLSRKINWYGSEIANPEKAETEGDLGEGGNAKEG